MIKKIIKQNWQIISLEIFILLIFTFFYGKFGDIMIDSFREFYIPKQVLEGKVLYKDIFVIYPPLAYLINTFTMKVFGTGFNVLFLLGLFSTMGITYLTYNITKYFSDSKLNFAICLFLISGLVLSPNVFNSFFPYSYGILYGVLFALSSMYFVLNKKYPLGYFFCALAILCKYEFLLLLPILIFWTKKESLLKNIFYFTIPILFTISLLFEQGARVEDFQSTLNIITLMSQTKTLHWFYSIMGLEFRLEHLSLYIVNIIKFSIPLGLILAIPKIHELIKNYNAYIIYTCLIFFIAISLFAFSYQDLLIFSFPLILIMLIIKHKNLKQEEKLFILASLLISLKVFFALTLQAYGAFFIPFALISLLILTPKKIKEYLLISLLLWSVSIGVQNGIALYEKDMTKLDNIVEYVKENTKSTDTIVAYPECLAINVLANRKSDNKFYSLIPLYVETFGEDLIKKRLEIVMPEYIIINDYDTSAYYFKNFGIDYATDIKKWIENNYTQEAIVNSHWEFKIYKRKSN